MFYQLEKHERETGEWFHLLVFHSGTLGHGTFDFLPAQACWAGGQRGAERTVSAEVSLGHAVVL